MAEDKSAKSGKGGEAEKGLPASKKKGKGKTGKGSAKTPAPAPAPTPAPASTPGTPYWVEDRPKRQILPEALEEIVRANGGRCGPLVEQIITGHHRYLAELRARKAAEKLAAARNADDMRMGHPDENAGAGNPGYAPNIGGNIRSNTNTFGFGSFGNDSTSGSGDFGAVNTTSNITSNTSSNTFSGLDSGFDEYAAAGALLQLRYGSGDAAEHPQTTNNPGYAPNTGGSMLRDNNTSGSGGYGTINTSDSGGSGTVNTTSNLNTTRSYTSDEYEAAAALLQLRYGPSNAADYPQTTNNPGGLSSSNSRPGYPISTTNSTSSRTTGNRDAGRAPGQVGHSNSARYLRRNRRQRPANNDNMNTGGIGGFGINNNQGARGSMRSSDDFGGSDNMRGPDNMRGAGNNGSRGTPSQIAGLGARNTGDSGNASHVDARGNLTTSNPLGPDARIRDVGLHSAHARAERYYAPRKQLPTSNLRGANVPNSADDEEENENDEVTLEDEFEREFGVGGSMPVLDMGNGYCRALYPYHQRWVDQINEEVRRQHMATAGVIEDEEDDQPVPPNAATIRNHERWAREVIEREEAEEAEAKAKSAVEAAYPAEDDDFSVEDDE